MIKLINIFKSIVAVLWNKTTGLVLLAIVFDCISRYCWKSSVLIYYVGQDLMVSTLLYIIYTYVNGVNKIILESLLVLSGFQIIDDILREGSIDCPLREIAMFGIGIWTVVRIGKVIRNTKN